jgi:alanine dehydrogenase
MHDDPIVRPIGKTIGVASRLAPDKALTEALLAQRIVAIAYETIETADGRLPLLEPMSEVAGRMSVHVAATYLARLRHQSGSPER